jgi:4-amino-4-deoxy-L-arabinose transferase-like glycosyltransferase
MESRAGASGEGIPGGGARVRYQVIVLLVAALVFLGCMISPPSLMDDVDAVQAQIAQNMLQSGDWVTARLDGVAYLEKSPLKYWMIAVSFMVFGVHDWAARIPVALSAILLCWVVARFAAWAFGQRTGLYAGLAMATSIGLFLFTRILIPDVILTLAITIALWGLLRALEETEPHPTAWAMAMWASMGIGMLLKGLIAAAFPVAVGLIYVSLTRQWGKWRRLSPFAGIGLLLLIAAPWHVLATVRNPPYFDFTMHSEKGSYQGFFWFYFMNEHVLRFLNLRYPRDYNTVPRWLFWAFHVLWFFPWSFYAPAAWKLSYRRPDRASRTRLLCVCWAAFILVFFTFSTTQEYYSMPCYPALAILTACAMASGSPWLRVGTKLAAALATLAFVAIAAILWMVRGMAAPGDIASALNSNPDVYTLSLGHMLDLTLSSFAYLKLPLVVAGVAFGVGAIAGWRAKGMALVGFTVMLVLFFHAARLALVVFDPYLSSRPLAEALNQAPPGELIVDDQYYTFSSVFFYTNRRAYLLNGRVNNLDYGSYAPDAPKNVFIDDEDFKRKWTSGTRYYLVIEAPKVDRLKRIAGADLFHVKQFSGGKYLFSNF